jgi:DNA polymerase
MASREDLVAHVRYYADLGVEGFTREKSWRTRVEHGARDAHGGAPGAPGAGAHGATPSGEAGPEPVAGSPEPGVIQISRKAAALAAIRDDLGDCTRCKLHSGRTNLVFGVGNPEARLMFVGEGPGADEDEQGIPFVGRAGQLLTQIIRAMGFERDDVYIANVVKCRPPGNRNPEPDEIERCEPFLVRQIEAITPIVIVALGKFAAQTLLRSDVPITRLRGQFFKLRDVDVMPTFHPSYLLRNPSAKREVWEDMKKVMARLKDAQ